MARRFVRIAGTAAQQLDQEATSGSPEAAIAAALSTAARQHLRHFAPPTAGRAPGGGSRMRALDPQGRQPCRRRRLKLPLNGSRVRLGFARSAGSAARLRPTARRMMDNSHDGQQQLTAGTPSEVLPWPPSGLRGEVRPGRCDRPDRQSGRQHRRPGGRCGHSAGVVDLTTRVTTACARGSAIREDPGRGAAPDGVLFPAQGQT
jgi:hypothetical protein